ncbi:Uncharacterised protein [Klebsiella pneumoniae]|nr:Uncharacterised protein [Klebsiella pneumoniae]
MFTSQYTVNDTYRVPTYLGYQPDHIARGASLFKDKLTADQLQPLNFGSKTPDEFVKSQTLYEVKNNAHWVNNSDEDTRAQNLQGLRETYGGQSQSGPSFAEGMGDTNANNR